MIRERKHDLIVKPGDARSVKAVLDAGRAAQNRFVALKREIAEVSNMEGRGLIVAMLQDPRLRSKSMPLEDFLIHVRGWGASKVVAVCVACEVAADRPVAELTDEQIGRLVARLERKEWK